MVFLIIFNYLLRGYFLRFRDT